MYDIKVIKGTNYKIDCIFLNVQRKSYKKSKTKVKLVKIIAACITKNIFIPSIYKKGLSIKKKSLTAIRKMGIILRKENLDDF